MTPRLKLELDRPDGHYDAWDTLSGRVVVESDEPIACRQFSVELRVSTSGDGNYETSSFGRQDFELPLGVEVGRHEYPVEIPLPGRPITMRGEHVNLDIAVAATLHPAGYGTIEDAIPIEITSGDGKRTFEQSEREAVLEPFGCGVQLSYVVMGFGLLVGFILASNSDSATLPWLELVIPTLVGFAIAAPIFFLSTRNTLAAKKLGKVEYEVVPVHEDGRFFAEARVMIEPSQGVSLNLIRFELDGYESVTEEFNQEEKHLHTEIVLDDVLLAENVELEGRKIRRFSGRIELPVDAPTTLEMKWNRVLWETTLRIDVAGGVDHVEDGRLEMMVARPASDDEFVLGVDEETGADENVEVPAQDPRGLW